MIEFLPEEIPLSAPPIINSGTGWHRGYDWGPGAKSCDVGTRINWRDLEPERDRYDFTKIEELLEDARKRGGRGIVRFRGVASSGIGMPDYMIKLIPKGFTKDWLFNKKPETFCYVPDWNDPNYIERGRALLKAIGAKYNHDQRLGLIDIGMYGRWGEWHSAAIKYPTESGAQEVTEESLKAFVDMHLEAFPDKRLVMMTDNIFGLKYAFSKSDRIGWRRDSYGTDWFQNPERMAIVADRWKTAPVVAEPIGEFKPGNIAFCKKMERQAADFHVATINGINTYHKGQTYSPAEMAAVENAGKNSGFRFSIARISIPEKLFAGHPFVVSAAWENQGVTPAYEKWQVCYQLRSQGSGELKWEGVSSLDLETLLPTGAQPLTIKDSFNLPAGMEPGTYDLAVTVKDRETDYRSPLALAIRGRQLDGTYCVGTVICQK